MSATGWQTRHTNAPFDPWVGSNLDTGATVFGRTRDEVSREIAAYEGQRAINAQWLQRTGSR
jgi:hypothetical protein